MRSGFFALLFFLFMSIITAQSAFSYFDFHCESHCESSSGTEAHHSQESPNEAPRHEHAGTCIHSFFVSIAETNVEQPEKPEEIFSENLFSMKPGPCLDGPIQPPRAA
jgi:hypothetical protein